MIVDSLFFVFVFSVIVVLCAAVIASGALWDRRLNSLEAELNRVKRHVGIKSRAAVPEWDQPEEEE